jgi:hypothetical protein
MKKIIAFVLLSSFGLTGAIAQSQKQAEAFRATRNKLYKWEGWDFLLGTWRGSGKGFAGSGPGEFTFKPDLDGKVLVFTNEQHFEATAAKPAFVYRSVIYVYLFGLTPRADLFDNEGHYLTFNVEVSPKTPEIVMTSTETAPGFPRFRFRYAQKSKDQLDISFDIAGSGAPTKFESYVSGTVERAPATN